jgi:hypothetical protein
LGHEQIVQVQVGVKQPQAMHLVDGLPRLSQYMSAHIGVIICADELP